jgi:uncharacterized Rossmann fold enzyme
MSLIAEYIEQACLERAQTEERACRAMLQDPQRRGVLVTDYDGGYTVELSERVPHMTIHNVRIHGAEPPR